MEKGECRCKTAANEHFKVTKRRFFIRLSSNLKLVLFIHLIHTNYQHPLAIVFPYLPYCVFK